MPAPLLAPVALAIAREFLPGLASRLSGPRREAVAREIVAVTAQMLARPAADLRPAEAVAELADDPARADALRLELAAIDQREDELWLRDRMDARARFAAMAERDRGRAPWLVAGVFGLLILAIFALVGLEAGGFEAPQGVALLVAIATGAATKLWSVFDFVFGSSEGSKIKDAAIAERLQERPVEPLPAPPAPTPAPQVASPAPTSPAQAAEAVPARPARDLVGEIMEMAA
jgi:hypothetical protein